jgi:hypothetical protein
VNDRAYTALEAVAGRLAPAGSATLIGTEAEQIRLLYVYWTGFKKHCVSINLLDPSEVDLVIEDFVLFPGEKPGKSTTVPERISWGFEGYRMAMADSWRRSLPKHYNEVIWQKSGAAHRFKNQKILKKADAWVVGRDHERSAFSHMILRVNVLMDGKRPGAHRPL